jgi:hypothetical protein
MPSMGMLASRAQSPAQIITRGFAAAHGALRGALYLTLLHAPAQVVSALLYGLQKGPALGPERLPESGQVILALAGAGIGLALAVAVFFLFPFIQGGILGLVRGRLGSTGNGPGPFGAYARANYLRLLGSQTLFVVLMIAAVAPVICLGAGLAFQDLASTTPVQPGEPSAAGPDPQQLQRQLLSHPAMLAGLVLVSVFMSAVGMVYWVANCIVVTEPEGVMAAWRRSLRFCRANFSAVVVVWLLNLVAGVVMAPLPLVGQLGYVTDPWALSVLAIIYSALIGYWGVVLAGLSMALYLGRRTASGQSELVPLASGTD